LPGGDDAVGRAGVGVAVLGHGSGRADLAAELRGQISASALLFAAAA